MKKFLIFTVIAFFGFALMNAQDINFGAKAGVNFASITGDDTDDLDMRTSLHVGVVAEIVISETFSFQPELLYSAQGAKESIENVDLTFKVDYLAYSYEEDEGLGFRFREAYNERYVHDLRFVDYNNYKSEDTTMDLLGLDKAFEAGNLKLLSKIELKNIKVN